MDYDSFALPSAVYTGVSAGLDSAVYTGVSLGCLRVCCIQGYSKRGVAVEEKTVLLVGKHVERIFPPASRKDMPPASKKDMPPASKKDMPPACRKVKPPEQAAKLSTWVHRPTAASASASAPHPRPPLALAASIRGLPLHRQSCPSETFAAAALLLVFAAA
ncbi:hypothetical protein EG328_010810 [Venturia inaequalis]|uniref:Uncharacterized protein n=1 Tax=Venturia inaequalis TaxID=5025 RepID=A0A8H3V7E9_VENIN|nr:hypothetical protein EG328_010810 [Venturia inaequalis]RDI80293.1 U2 snRNP component [Venturia inaequalis]